MDGGQITHDFALGFVLGQTDAYIEQVKAGAKLAAQIGCSVSHAGEVVAAAEKEGCKTLIEERGYGRVAVWIYRLPFVRSVIADVSEKATPPTIAGVWAMGKLFGYGDSEIAAYLDKCLGELLVQNPDSPAIGAGAIGTGSEDISLVEDLRVGAHRMPVLAGFRCRCTYRAKLSNKRSHVVNLRPE